MYVTLGLFLPFLLSFVSLVFPQSRSLHGRLSATATRDVSRHSQTLEALNSNISPNCVSQERNPDWAGDIDATDCKDALLAIDTLISRWGRKYFTFWSDEYESSPLRYGWKLPWSASSGRLFSWILFYPPNDHSRRRLPGTCVALFRIARNFGDDVLPYPELWPGPLEYIHASGYPKRTEEEWKFVLKGFRALLPCVETHPAHPSWTLSDSAGGVLLLLPSTSAMAQRWANGNGILGGFNGTSLGLVDVS